MSGNPPAAAAAADWRQSVLQSYRNSEVREISKVLAALEGSASVTPASKLMLAMRFEDQIFKSAKDLADYRKKIQKRLKKLQKNYKAPAKQSPQAQGQAQKGGTSGSGTSGVDNTEAKEELTAKLKRDYGDELRYIVRNAKVAVADLQKKLGPEKAQQLQQHTDSCRMWARDLQLFSLEEWKKIGPSSKPEKEKATKATTEAKSETKSEPQSTAEATPKQTPPKAVEAPEASYKPVPMSLSQIQRVAKHLETRVGNIRSYVVKHADPDLFLLETLQSRDVSLSKNSTAGNLLRDALQGRISTQREMLQKATANNNNTPSTTTAKNEEEENPLLVLQKALEKAQAGVPPPTRDNSMKLEGSLRHLDKMRAASTAMMTYWRLSGDQRLATAPRDTLKKIHEVIQEGVDFCLEGVKELEQKKQQQRRFNGKPGDTVAPGSNDPSVTTSTTATIKSTPKVSLQDAWSKTIELPSVAPPISVEDEENTANNNNQNGSNKRPRTNSYKPYYKTRMLFRPKRKTPQPLLASIRRKGAHLRQANSGNTNAMHLVLDFDDAFCMTIYFSPLTVTLRAKGREESQPTSSSSPFAPWKPLSHGLTPWSSTLDSSDFLRRKAQEDDPQQQLSVWGVTGGYDSIGRVVEERLRDASTHATAMLRRCFKNHVKDKTNAFEVELLEGSALLEFLQLARSTYMPHWEDEDV